MFNKHTITIAIWKLRVLTLHETVYEKVEVVHVVFLINLFLKKKIYHITLNEKEKIKQIIMLNFKNIVDGNKKK